MRTPLSSLFTPQFVKFCVVGGLGLITDQTIFFFMSRLTDPASVFVNLVWVGGYSAAVLQNYLINHYWTFKSEMGNAHASGSGFMSFFAISVTALIPRFLAYKAVILVLGTGHLVLNFANLCGIGAGTVVNFWGSKFLVFREKKRALP